MIIDSHIHVGKAEFSLVKHLDFDYDLFNGYEDTILMMNENKVDKAVIFPVPHIQIDPTKSNEYIYEAYLKYPDRFIPFCRIDSNLEDNLLSGRFKGVKIHMLYEQIELKAIKKQLQVIEDAGVPLVVHALFKDKVGQIDKINKYAPNIKIILAHMGRGHLYTGEQVVDNALKLKQYPNVYMDLSTVGDIQTIINCCEIIGYNKVLYASDYPFGLNYYKEQYSYMHELKTIRNALNSEQAELIFHKNIEHLLCLEQEDNIHIRRVRRNDYEEIMALFDAIDKKDSKYLALKNKFSLIKQIIKSEKHCYVAVISGRIVGFMRESGRPENFSLLEEIVVNPDCRGKGIASSMLDYYHNAFKKNMAKTNAENSKMISLLIKKGYHAINPEAQRIINWEREED